MTKKRYKRPATDDATGAITDASAEEQSTSKKTDINTILLGIILVVVVIQTVMMMGNGDDDRPVPNNAQTAQTTPQQNQSGGQDNPLINMDQNQQPGVSASGAVASYNETQKDFGTVAAGEKKRHTFKVTNSGTGDLQYGDITADDGASVVSFPRNAIPPGGTGEITVELDATGKSGPLNPVIHVNSNAEPAHFHLNLNANVQ